MRCGRSRARPETERGPVEEHMRAVRTSARDERRKTTKWGWGGKAKSRINKAKTRIACGAAAVLAETTHLNVAPFVETLDEIFNHYGAGLVSMRHSWLSCAMRWLRAKKPDEEAWLVPAAVPSPRM